MESEKMFNLMEKIYIEMQNGFSQVNQRIGNLESKVDNLESKVNSLETKVDNLEVKVDKNTLILEKVQNDVKTLAEVQQSYSEELDRTKDKDGRTLGERLEIIELAITNVSKSSSENFDILNAKIDDLQFDVNNLSIKTTKTDNKVILFERQLRETDKRRG